MSKPDLMISGGIDAGGIRTDVYGYFECHHLTLNHEGPCPTCAAIAQTVEKAEEKLAKARKTFNENYLALSDNIDSMVAQAVEEERERIKESLHIAIAEGTGSNDLVYVSLIHGIIGKYFAILEADNGVEDLAKGAGGD